MRLGRRCKERQASLWLAADQLGNGPRNAFYEKLNELLAEIGFDEKLEAACEPYYARSGRKGLAPGVYFRMLFIGFFEDISSQRGIACGARIVARWPASWASRRARELPITAL